MEKSRFGTDTHKHYYAEVYVCAFQSKSQKLNVATFSNLGAGNLFEMHIFLTLLILGATLSC